MKLKNRNAIDFVGRTIIYRHQAWRIDAVGTTGIRVSKTGIARPGLLRHEQFADCRLFPTIYEVNARYPKLIRAVGCICNISAAEASRTVRGLLTTGSYYMDSEAVAQIGGAEQAIQQAWRQRHRLHQGR